LIGSGGFRKVDGVRFLLNGEAQEVEGTLNVAALLERFGLQRRRVAVAINTAVIPRSRFDEVEIREGDRIEVIQAVGGG
jgi:thiamine biosynthesis protein ThiS